MKTDIKPCNFLHIIMILFLSNLSIAMPPAPGLIEQMREDGSLEAFKEREQDARRRGMNAPFVFNPDILRRDEANEAEIKTICILVDFDDNEADLDLNPREHFQEMLFSVDSYRSGSMRDWFLENSFGEVNVVGEAFGWYRMPEDYAWYVDGQQGWGNFPQNSRGLVRDALWAADEEVDFSQFDNGEDGVVEALFVVHAGQGAESTNSDDMIWSHAWNVPNITLDGVGFSRYAMEPETGAIGVFGHELGHSYFGLPDLYDGSYESAGIGQWSMMSGGSWGGRGLRPVHFDAWCRAQVGFIEPVSLTENEVGIILEPVEEGGDIFQTWRNGRWGNQYFMLENRQQIGFDGSLPASGLLIWHIDENTDNNRNPWWPGSGNRRHFKVALEQADGAYNLEHNNNSGDFGDPFPGSSHNMIFAGNTEPDSRDYLDSETDVTVYNIEPYGERDIYFSFALEEGVGPDPMEMFLLERVPENHTYEHPDEREVTTDEVSLITGLFNELWINIRGHGSQLPQDLSEYTLVFYIESWREQDVPDEGLSLEEQEQLTGFLDEGGKLIMIGPDIATNLQGEDNPLWAYLKADYLGEGVPSEDRAIRLVSSGETARLSGMRFPFVQGGPCDHYVDEVGAGEGAYDLFTDQAGRPRGVMVIERDYRIVLQSFLSGGLIDWGGEKIELISDYMRLMQFYLSAPVEDLDRIMPVDPALISAYPNPFNGRIIISYTGQQLFDGLAIYDLQGRMVDRLNINQFQTKTTWQPIGIPSGLYIIQADGIRNSRWSVGMPDPLWVIYMK